MEKAMNPIKDLRERRRYSQETLADRARVSRATIQRLERGNTAPSQVVLHRVLKALQATPADMNEFLEFATESLRIQRQVTRVVTIIAGRNATCDELEGLPGDLQDVIKDWQLARQSIVSAAEAAVAQDELNVLKKECFAIEREWLAALSGAFADPTQEHNQRLAAACQAMRERRSWIELAHCENNLESAMARFHQARLEMAAAITAFKFVLAKHNVTVATEQKPWRLFS
jgi:transcriptional regulator with XRE-family HTH domain